jgi:hypothetical protein
MTISRSFILKMRKCQVNLIEKIRTYILYPISFPQNRAVYGIMWENMVEPERPEIAI